VFEYLPLEVPIIRHKFVVGRVGEHRGHRIAAHPYLNVAAADGVAEEEYVGALVGRVDVRATLFEIALRVRLNIPIDRRHVQPAHTRLQIARRRWDRRKMKAGVPLRQLHSCRAATRRVFGPTPRGGQMLR